MRPTILILWKSLAVRSHRAHLKDRETEAQGQEAAWPAPPPPLKRAAGSGQAPLPPGFAARGLSISLIRTIDLFILSG